MTTFYVVYGRSKGDLTYISFPYILAWYSTDGGDYIVIKLNSSKSLYLTTSTWSSPKNPALIPLPIP